MNFEDLMIERHSVREFKKDEIAAETLKEIVRIAGISPSWENSQPWNVYIATGEISDEIREEWIFRHEKEIKGSPDMPTGHRTDFSKRGQENMASFLNDVCEYCEDPDMELFKQTQAVLFNAPALVYLTLPKGYTKWSVYDLGGFGMSLMLAAKELGVDSIPAYEIVKYPDVIRQHMDIPDDEDLIMGIALGYEVSDKINEYRSPRLDVDEILTIR